MFTVIKKYIKQDVTTPFFFEVIKASNDYKFHIKSTYIDTKKLLSMTNEISDDTKSQTISMTFATKEDFLDFAVDPVLFLEYGKKLHLYNLKNNIKTETTIGE